MVAEELIADFLANAGKIVANTDGKQIKLAVEAAGSNQAYIITLWLDFLKTLKQGAIK